MVYLTNNNELWGTGNVPGKGQCLKPEKLMENVVYVSCGANSILLIKEDETAWIAGTLGETLSYPQYTQVLEHVKYVNAKGNAVAAIRTDDTLWMWGDNRFEQCAVREKNMDLSTVKEPTMVMDDVKIVWTGKLGFNSEITDIKETSPSGLSKSENRTFIQKKDSTLWVCGENASNSERIFVPLQIEEE